MKQCKDNENEAQFIPLGSKYNIKRMATEQGSYEHVVMLHQMDLKFIAESKNKNEDKFKFQGQSVISQRWFNLDLEWIEVDFITLEPDSHKNIFQIHENTQDTNTFIIFQVPIGNSKCVENVKFHNDAPMIKYRQKSLNSYCFSSLESDFF